MVVELCSHITKVTVKWQGMIPTSIMLTHNVELSQLYTSHRHMTVLKSETTEGNFRKPQSQQSQMEWMPLLSGHVSTVVLLAAFLFEKEWRSTWTVRFRGGWDAHCRTGA